MLTLSHSTPWNMYYHTPPMPPARIRARMVSPTEAQHKNEDFFASYLRGHDLHMFNATSLLTFKIRNGLSLGRENNILLPTKSKPEALRGFLFPNRWSAAP